MSELCECGHLTEWHASVQPHKGPKSYLNCGKPGCDCREFAGSVWLRQQKAQTLRDAATQIRTEAHEAMGKVPERYFSGLMDAAAYLDKTATNITTDRT